MEISEMLEAIKKTHDNKLPKRLFWIELEKQIARATNDKNGRQTILTIIAMIEIRESLDRICENLDRITVNFFEKVKSDKDKTKQQTI